ncbi:uncharacterized protein C5orf34 homolog isoform X2 [Pristis pectinata]|uniref:uncharacterized protein C5orf34 homolog isoform X2 n=1 Tax=Pristis pectinata TaxID=685728 RepID=UPI00223CDEE6|nr:uncharacterized protein C5orf34 homolog isoform X2 [Pristis pectinata]
MTASGWHSWSCCLTAPDTQGQSWARTLSHSPCDCICFPGCSNFRQHPKDARQPPLLPYFFTELFAMALVSLMVIYEDDSVEIQYTDGSNLQLSPCGSEFMIEKGPAPNLHPLQSCCRVRQRTPFVISIYKEQVLHALEFRNRFASRPYLPADLITADKLLNLFLDISEVKWPGANSEGAVTVADNGQVTVSSLGGHAFFYLSPSQLEFTVEFLVRVSQSILGKPHLKPGLVQSDGLCQPPCSDQENVKPVGLASGHNGSERRTRSWQNQAPGAARPCESHLKDRGSTEIYSKYKYQYTWVVQHHTVSWCPPEWRHPLSLALRYNRQQDKSPGPDRMGDHPGSPDKPGTPGPVAVPEVTTVLRSALPLNCPAPHLHRWRYRNVLSQRKLDLETCLCSEPVKVVWCQGVVYRVIAGSVTSVEIYPGDGSVLKPHDTMSNYFTHYRVGHTDGQGEERMYRVSSLPPDTAGSKYSVRSVVTRAVRILQCWNQFKLSLKPPSVSCWKTEEFQSGLSNQLPVILAEEVIRNVGRFLAFSDGRVHITFCNGVRLNTTWDFGSQCRREEQTLSQQWDPLILPMAQSETQTDMMPGWYQLLFPDGSSQLVQMHSAGSYERYLTAATDWCRYVNENPHQRKSKDLPKLQASGQDENWSVISELQKIQRFNFLLENSNCLKRESSSCAGPVAQQPTAMTSSSQGEEGWSVEGALRQTGRAIQDIELLLEANQKVRRGKSAERDAP